MSDNRYEISFASTGTGAVTDANGAGISGNWTNGSSTFPSGNGLAGSGASSDFNFLFNALPGNATRSGAVIGSSDYVGTSAKLNDAMSNANYNRLLRRDRYGGDQFDRLHRRAGTVEQHLAWQRS